MPTSLRKPAMPHRCVCCGLQLASRSVPVWWRAEVPSLSAQPGNVGGINFPLCKECGVAARALERKTPFWPALVSAIVIGLLVYWHIAPSETTAGAIIGAILFGAFAASMVQKLTRYIVEFVLSEKERLKLAEIKDSVRLYGGPFIYVELRDLQFSKEFLELNEQHGVE